MIRLYLKIQYLIQVLLKNSIYYVIFVSETKKEIKIGDLINKNVVKISTNQTFTLDSIKIRFYSGEDYSKSELINKTIKINYLQSFNNLINKTYNQNISVINNDINNINISNNAYYNFKSTNLSIITSNDLKSLRWTTPYATIRFSLKENSIINYINLEYLSDNNDNVNKAHLYYIENEKINYIGGISDIKLSNMINNSYNKKIIYYILSLLDLKIMFILNY